MTELQDDFSRYGVTAALFNEWRTPRFGDCNPSSMNNCVWEWLIRTKHSAYTATQTIDGPSAISAGPGWCFDRFGQSCTTLPDGKKVYIAGEHEDYYDPDFYIYNDVVVEDKDGSIAIYGYPRESFPPTDFHSATLVGSEIIIIGSLGYPEDREPGSTPVFSLDTNTFAMRRLVTCGEMPGWIHEHRAVLSDDENSILITGGKIDRGSDHFLIENINDWHLNLKSGIWECVTRRNWPRWEVSRPDRKGNHLWEIRQALWNLEVGRKTDYVNALSSLTDALGKEPDVKSVEKLYNPDIPHDSLPEREEEYDTYRIRVDGITVRYVEKQHCIYITVEGELPELTIRQLVEDVRSKLSSLENAEYHAAEIA